MNLKRWKKMKILCFNGKSGNIWEHILGTYISSVSTIYTIYIYICYHCYHCYHSYPYRKKNILIRLIIIIYFVNILTKNENILFYIRTTKKVGTWEHIGKNVGFIGLGVLKMCSHMCYHCYHFF